MAITETWLKGHKKAELKIDGYEIYRADRKGRKHTTGRFSGGSALYLRQDLAATSDQILEFSNGVVEVLATYSRKENLLIAVVYRQPDDPAGGHPSGPDEFNEALVRLKDTIESLEGTPDILLCGDFNLPKANWTSPAESSCPLTEKMISFQNNFFLNQVVNKPTHRSGNTLDLVLTNNTHLISDINSQPSALSDHYVVEAQTHYKSHFSRTQRKHRKVYNKFDTLNFFSEDTDWNMLRMELSEVNWDQEFDSLNDPSLELDKFTAICENISTKHVPSRKKPDLKGKSRVPRDRRILMRRRNKVSKQLSKKQPPSMRKKLTNELFEIELKLQDSFSCTMKLQEEKAVQAIRRNPKYFFSYVKKFSKCKPAAGPLLNKDKQFVVDSKEMANLLGEQYSSVFSNPNSAPIDPDIIFEPNHEDNLLDFEFSPADIIDAINDISENAAAGPDGFPAILLKQCKDIIAIPLYRIWRKYLDLGITPSSLKTSNIVPIHKGDSTAQPSNYRPVALTSHLVKIFEKIVRAHIVTYLESNQLLNPSQHGFRSGRSCLSQLIAHYDKILALLEKGVNVDVVYLDFAKAFDKLDFNITLKKLSMLGINGKIGKWLHSFLTNRTQTVLVNGEKSQPAPVISGVPQGSVIGPLLFLVLISDIDEGIYNSFVSSFADDTRVGCGIASAEDAANLQEDLERIYSWAVTNNMLFNSKKFELLRYGSNAVLKAETTYLSDNHNIIETKASTKDLGVIMSSSADFKDHISALISTVRDLSSWILRSFNSRSPVLMLQLWKSLVIPRLDYCSQLWSPNQVGLIQQLEELQRVFLKRIYGFRDKPYHEALDELGLYSLQRRRERYQVIYLWCILESKVPNIIASSANLITPQSATTSRKGRTIFIRPIKRSGKFANLRFHSLPFNGARLFNCLPKYVRNITECSKDFFKSKLDSYLKKILDMPLLRSNYPHRQFSTNSLIEMVNYSYPYGPRREETALAGLL